MTTQTVDAAEIVAKLTKARQAMILALPIDGSWGRVPSRGVAKRAWWNMIPPILDHKHCPEDDNEWRLSDFGRQVAHLLQQERSA